MPTGSVVTFLASAGGTSDQMCSGMIGRSASVTSPSSGQGNAHANRTVSASTASAVTVGMSATWCVQRPVGASRM